MDKNELPVSVLCNGISIPLALDIFVMTAAERVELESPAKEPSGTQMDYSSMH